MTQERDPNDSDLYDRELPDESDMDQDGDGVENDDTEPCPLCHRPVYAEAACCPYCGIDISWERVHSRKPVWVVLIILLCLMLMVIFFTL